MELLDVMPTLLEAAGLEIPESVDGSSLLGLAGEKKEGWRPFVQGEHTTCYTREHGMQYVTDGREKYIWFHHTDKEQFFDLQQDPHECHDLSGKADQQARIETWRQRLAEVNEQRGDPRGRDGRLVPQPNGALQLSPNYYRWKERADEMMREWRGD